MNEINHLPNFYIIGAAKAGTTTLFDLLKQHAQVFLPFNKEPMYFSHDDNYQRGVGWYARTYFNKSSTFPARGEATPHYLYWGEKVAPRIHQLYADEAVKFILMLRDPVSRAYSWYWNMVKEGREDLPFDKAVELENQRLAEDWDTLRYNGWMTYGYVRGSSYATALAPYLALFPPKNFLFILQDDLVKNFSGTINRLLAFLALDPCDAIQPITSNKATLPRSRKFQTWLRKQSNLQSFLVSYFPLRLRHSIKARLLQVNARLARYPTLDPSFERELRMKFIPEIEMLAKIIDRDLSSWLPR